MSKHPRPRWRLTIWRSSAVVPARPVQVETRSFRWQWLARCYAVLAVPPLLHQLGYYHQIELEPPKLRVIEGGGAYEPRSVV